MSRGYVSIAMRAQKLVVPDELVELHAVLCTEWSPSPLATRRWMARLRRYDAIRSKLCLDFGVPVAAVDLAVARRFGFTGADEAA